MFTAKVTFKSDGEKDVCIPLNGNFKSIQQFQTCRYRKCK